MIRTELQGVCFCCFISICLWTNFYIWVIWILYAIWYLVSLYLKCQILCKCIINDTSTLKFRPHRIHLVGPSFHRPVRPTFHLSDRPTKNMVTLFLWCIQYRINWASCWQNMSNWPAAWQLRVAPWKHFSVLFDKYYLFVDTSNKPTNDDKLCLAWWSVHTCLLCIMKSELPSTCTEWQSSRKTSLC